MKQIDSDLARRRANAAADGFDEAAFLHTEIRDRLLERLEWIALEPARILDLGCGTGAAHPTLSERFPDALVFGVDQAERMLALASGKGRSVVCGDALRLPIADNSVDLIFSNLALNWCEPAADAFREARRVLRSPGLFSFTVFGPDTLREFRAAWADADSHPHVHGFTDMHNVGDALVQAGFSEPVMDAETLTVTYSDVRGIVADLRGAAANNCSPARNRGLTGRSAWNRMLAAYEALRDDQSRLPVTMEIVYGHAWAGDDSNLTRMQEGVASFPVSRLRRRR